MKHTDIPKYFLISWKLVVLIRILSILKLSPGTIYLCHTRAGNVVSPSMTQLCDMLGTDYQGITIEMIIKSLKVCVQCSDCQFSDILTFKDSKTCCEWRDNLQSMWNLDRSSIYFELLALMEPEVTITR